MNESALGAVSSDRFLRHLKRAVLVAGLGVATFGPTACDDATSNNDASAQTDAQVGGNQGDAGGTGGSQGGSRGHPGADAGDALIAEDAGIPDEHGIYTIAEGMCYPPCIEALRAMCPTMGVSFVCSEVGTERYSCFENGVRERSFEDSFDGEMVRTNARTLLDGRTPCLYHSYSSRMAGVIVRDANRNLVASVTDYVMRDGRFVAVFTCHQTGQRYYAVDDAPEREYCRGGRIPPPGGCQPGACEWLGPR